MTRGLGVVTRWTLGVYLIFLGYVLLGPSPTVPTQSVSFLGTLAQHLGISARLASPERVEFVANVLIIVPVGALGSLIWTRLNWRDWTALGFLLAGSIELFQAAFLAARTATFVDVVANTLGAGLGRCSSTSRGAGRPEHAVDGTPAASRAEPPSPRLDRPES